MASMNLVQNDYTKSFWLKRLNELLSKEKAVVAPLYMSMAKYAAEQCTGYSDSPMILAIKAQQAMLQAHENGENPLQKLNDFLGTEISEEVMLSITKDCI